MKRFSCLIPCILLFLSCFCQKSKDDNYIPWSATRKLTVKDFVIKTKDYQTAIVGVQVLVDYQFNGFDFMTRDFNKKITNYFMKSASWIDTTYDLTISLRYAQMLFDMNEIYTRRFRKEIRENRKKFLKGTEFVREIETRLTTEFAHRRIDYDTETKFGTDLLKQLQWEAQIRMELNDLKEFAGE